MSIRTPYARVQGLGSAKEGVGHFIAQRLSAAALIPLFLIFIAFVISIADADYETFKARISSPLMATPLLLLILTGFYHMRIGVQVVIEDYIHKHGTKLLLLALNTFWAVGGALLCIYSVLKLSFAG